MKPKHTRRSFIKQSATIGAASMAGNYFLPEIIKAATSEKLDIASVTGKDHLKNTIESVALLGGMSRFVSIGARVAILANASFKYPATSVNPSILLATIQMCKDAGAKEVVLAKDVVENYWNDFELSDEQSKLFKSITIPEPKYEVIPIKDGIALKEAHFSKDLLEADVFINLAIVKHHTGTEFTGLLKNLMGACSHDPTCRFFHFGSNADAKEWYADPNHLSQCVADLNLVKKADLCIVDATKFITTNGPFGPGEIKTADNITAGTDAVALDSYCTKFLGLSASKVAMIGMAAKHRLGEASLDKLKIKEVTV